jgi:hypothetical protein
VLTKSEKEPSIKLREPTDRRLLLFIVPIFLLVAVTGLVDQLTETFGLAGAIFISLILMMPVGFLFVRGVVAGVRVSERGLTVVNLFKTYQFDWTQIQRFEFGYPEAWVWTWSPVAVLRDGTRIQLMPIQAPQPITRPKNTFDMQAVARLEAFHAAALRNGGTLPREAFLSAG